MLQLIFEFDDDDDGLPVCAFTLYILNVETFESGILVLLLGKRVQA